MTQESSNTRWLKRALIVSVGVNLAVLALAIGAALRGPPPSRERIGGDWTHAAALPPPQQENFKKLIRDRREIWKESRRNLRQRRAALADALRAEPFDIARVETLLREERRIVDALSLEGTNLLIEQITQMSPADRDAYAQRLLEYRRKRDRRRHD